MNNQNEQSQETFADRIRRLKEEDRAMAIALAKEKQQSEDATQTVGYRKSYFNNPVLPFGSVVDVDGDKATIQFEDSITAKYPALHTNEKGEVIVSRACILIVRDGKKERVALTPEVGQRGVVESIAFSGKVDLVFILDNREAA